MTDGYEHPNVRERRIRKTALVEANYAVASELAHGGLSMFSAAEFDERVIERARRFELYLDEGYDTARREITRQLTAERDDQDQEGDR